MDAKATGSEKVKELMLQDRYLDELRAAKTGVSIYLVNGIKLIGIVEGFDPFTVVLTNNGTQQLIYKHAISTVVPGDVQRNTAHRTEAEGGHRRRDELGLQRRNRSPQ